MPITLNHSNIGVQYSTGSNYIIETVKSDLYRRNELIDTITRDNLQTAPVTPSMYIENGTNNVYAVESYTYSGTANTADFTRVFTKSTTCDILIVGGGGGGGKRHGGGGGAGTLMYHKNIILNGTYNIKVGKGGTGHPSTTTTATSTATDGNFSQFVKSDGTQNYYAVGGGRGTTSVNFYANTNGGQGYLYDANLTLSSGNIFNSVAVAVSNKEYVNTLTSPEGCRGRIGGTQINNYKGGGGGGAGGVGMNHAEETTVNDGYGGLGLAIDITGTSVVYAGGGNGADFNGTVLQVFDPAYSTIQSRGGGGFGSDTGTAQNGLDGTGGGGGGQGNDTAGNLGGNGGSGIVIIRYLLGTIPSNNYLTSEPVVVAPTFTETTRTFAHSGGAETQTTHTITVGRDTICDILVVGGGGGGGLFGGGGGAGSILFANNLLLNAGSYTIKVGKGGTGASNDTANGTNGIDSSILINAIEYISKGGGGGGSRQSGAASFAGRNGSNGGSGGGGSSSDTIETIGGSTTTNTYKNWETYGNAGGKGKFGSSPWVSGGGGGAGSAGSDWSNTKGGNGGSGKSFVSYFGTNVGHNGWFGGGGGGNMYWPGGTFYDYGYGNGGNGLSGGGGNGANETNVEISATGGLPNTGGGGGGGKWDGTATNGGNGGSGIVIIKFKSTTAILDGITHKRLNFAYTPNYPIIQADNTNLKAWYKFDGNYMDSSPSGFNLTNSGATIVDGLIVQSVSTDSNDFLETSGINLNGKTYSLSFWLKFNTAPSGNIPLFTQGITDSLGTRVVFLYESSNKLRFSHYGSGNDMDTTGYNISSMVGTSWHHYVITYNNTNRGAEIWLDGIKLNTNVSTLTNTFTGSGNFTIARWGSTFNGLIEDFRYYDKILTSTEISQLYNIPTQNTYTINFPVPTIADINNNSNIVLRGAYDIALSTSNALIIPKEGQHIHNPSVLIRDSSERIYPPVRNFTSDTTIISGQLYGNGTYIVSASTFFIGEETFRVFNGTNSGWTQSTAKYDGSPAGTYTGLLSLGGFTGEWIKVQLPVSIKLTRYIIEASSIGGVNRAPSVYKIFGSNNNIDWEQVVYKSVPLVSADYISSKYEEKVSSNNYYRFFALVIGKNMGLDSWLGIGEWYIYGKEFSNNSLSIRYNILNPILDPIGAQWTYSSSNTNVYHMGSVGIGTTNPEYQLDVRGAIYSSVGGYTQTGLTTWTVTSDKRIKDNIVRASYDKCLENVKNIELYNFNFKNNCINTNDKHQLGFIAQEVQQVYPKAVEVGKIILNTNEAIDDILTLNTTQIDYTLYGAVKNLIEKIEDIDNDLENIEKAVGMGEPAPNAGN
jgi:hypothetical protein